MVLQANNTNHSQDCNDVCMKREINDLEINAPLFSLCILNFSLLEWLNNQEILRLKIFH